MNTVEILKAARELIADEKNWTQGAYARTNKGDEYSVSDLSEAECFCAVGAIHKAGGFDLCRNLPADVVIPFLIDDALSEYGDCYMEGRIVEFNDSHSHEDALALFDRAIARAESEAA